MQSVPGQGIMQSVNKHDQIEIAEQDPIKMYHQQGHVIGSRTCLFINKNVCYALSKLCSYFNVHVLLIYATLGFSTLSCSQLVITSSDRSHILKFGISGASQEEMFFWSPERTGFFIATVIANTKPRYPPPESREQDTKEKRNR